MEKNSNRMVGDIRRSRQIRRYTQFEILAQKVYRTFRPVPVTPLIPHDADICGIELVPSEALIKAYQRAIRSLKGISRIAYLEFGVYNGLSMSCMVEACKREKRNDIRIVGLDSFKGLPLSVVKDDGGIWSAGQFACSKTQALDCLNRRSVSQDRVVLEECWYDEITNERLITLLDGFIPAITMIDCDAYSSAITALRLLDSVAPREHIVFFDDWRLHDVDLKNGGEYRAFHEWLDHNPDAIVSSYPTYSRKAEAFHIIRNRIGPTTQF